MHCAVSFITVSLFCVLPSVTYSSLLAYALLLFFIWIIFGLMLAFFFHLEPGQLFTWSRFNGLCINFYFFSFSPFPTLLPFNCLHSSVGFTIGCIFSIILTLELVFFRLLCSPIQRIGPIVSTVNSISAIEWVFFGQLTNCYWFLFGYLMNLILQWVFFSDIK